MAWDNTVPAASDDIADALNYQETAQKVTELVQSQHFDLVERLAEEIAAMLMHDMKVPWLRLTLGKPSAVKSSSEVGVRIERGKAPMTQVYVDGVTTADLNKIQVIPADCNS